MTYRGTVKNGVVVLEDPKALPDDAHVSIRQLKESSRRRKGSRPLSLYERFKPFIGTAKGLPPDLAENHDHYLHGHPKK